MTAFRESKWVRKAFRGAVEGAFIVGLGGLLGGFIAQRDLAAAGRLALLAAAFGAFTFATGRAVSGKVLGAVGGGVAGLALGFILGGRFLGEYSYRTLAAVQTGQELQISGPTLTGETFDLQSLRGKVVLVDFWATWCGPCRAELPNVRSVYDRYHADGFEVVGVSLDTSRDPLADFVQKKQVPWPQIFFDQEGSRGWDNPLARRYGVRAIPEMILVDQRGRVVGGEVRGKALEPAVARLLGKGRPEGEGDSTEAARMTTELFPLGGWVGSLLGCIVGCFVGAGLERGGRRPPQGSGGQP